MRFSEDHLDVLTCSDSVQRPIHVWAAEQPKAVILAIHGGLAHAGDYVTPALYFRARGFATVSYDMVGHDRKRRVDIPSFENFLADTELLLKWIKRKYPQLPVFVMGHSMGALIATHLGLGRFAKDPVIKGFVLSSPYYVNAIQVPAVLLKLSSVLSKLFPTMKVPMESMTDMLTHDATITARHHADELDDTRASEASFRFAAALLGAQAALKGTLAGWRQPVFAVLAGQDKLANVSASQAMFKTMPQHLLDLHVYADNYHENFNETNREEIYASLLEWLEARLLAA
ncbi:alpha/beta fold hydrolase [Rhodoferax aquaticus]|uniref:Alpha/beta fold hydrolase n=1 Tax=Rhodoferax aquaticus TaxID=2527691 RepID=A0A515EQX9_9BURK|nr:alpha/beta fold hydrolase [Rhodoferax aquaticus]QDL55063.1 alpha/beta fold hydrolase [Rhodoferax aquaticus]